jgi:phage terminase Nu1 subunit (DNA packaging protein)
MAGLAQRDAAAFRSLAATFGERLAEIDPEAFRVISGEFARAALEAGRVPEQIELLARAAEKGDAGAVKFLAGELAGKIASLRMASASSGGVTRKNQERSFARTSGLRMTAGKSERRANDGEEKDAALKGSATQPASAANGAAAGRFVEGVNTEVEKNVLQSVGGRVAELLPDAPEATRRKIAGEIYRDLDVALKKDTALLQQVSANFQAAQNSGQFGEPQRAAMAALVMSKAKALLPGVAKRVVSEWTSAVMGASQARRAKQSAVAGRADVGVGGAPRPVSTQAARVNYGKMSDEEILNAE